MNKSHVQAVWVTPAHSAELAEAAGSAALAGWLPLPGLQTLLSQEERLWEGVGQVVGPQAGLLDPLWEQADLALMDPACSMGR